MHGFRWFAVLLIPFLLLSLNRIGSGKLLGYHHFRQAHTAMAAHNFAFFDANPLHPTIDGVTYGKDLYLNEFPLYPYLVGALWRAFGEHLILARLLSLAFTILALWCYYRLLWRFLADRLVVDLALVAMSLSPVVTYFGRCVERQSLFLFLLILGTYWLVVYLEEQRHIALLPAWLGLSLAILLNPFAVYIALPLGWYALRRKGAGALGDWRLYLIALGSVAPALAWYGHAIEAGRTLATGQMLAVNDHRNFASLAHYALWLDLDHWQRLFKTVIRFVVPSVPAVLVFFYGVAKAPRGNAYGFFRVWLLAVVVYFLVDFYPIAVVVHQYYYVNVVPLTSLFLAYGLAHLGRAAWASLGRVWSRDEEGWTLRIRIPRTRSLWLKTGLAALAAAWFLLDAVAGNREMLKDSWHAEYYALRESLPRYIPEGKRLTVVAEVDDPLFSYLLAPLVTHRLVKYSSARLDEILREQDFDYLAVSWDMGDIPLDEIFKRVEQAGCSGKPLMWAHDFLLFARDAAPDAVAEPLRETPCR